MSHLFRSFATVTATVSALLAASASLAADAPPQDEAISEVVVTGTRVAQRSRLDTLAPVDVVTSKALSEQGSTEVASALSRLAPSLDFPRPAATDGTDTVRPATLRGLSPDQTLLLVNSKRFHSSALVNLNGTVGRGSAAADLNALPLAAIESIEVLRDGASAQYGSDAIAGVVNVRLREAREGGAVSLQYGGYDTTVDTARGSRHESDGKTVTASSWVGLGLGAEGFLTLSGEYRDRDYTSRGDFDPRVTPAVVTSRFGDPDTRDLTFYVNAGLPLQSGWELYGWAGYQDRDATSAALPRLANNAANVPSIYPNGFLPLIEPTVHDANVALGTRGDWAGWQTDLSVVYGRNELKYDVANTLNPTYGAASATSFYAGELQYDQVVGNLSFVRGFELGLAAPLNVAWGAEARRETYQIGAGEPASYNRGTAVPAQTPGAQGFPGLQPSNVVDQSRNAYSGYLDLETRLAEKLLASAAGRYEHYSDFGSATTGKVSLRYDFTSAFALRGTASTGFRAPSLQQQYFTSTSTVFFDGVPFETGTFPSTSGPAAVLGGKALEPEKSRNYSLGAVLRANGFEATLDAYRIDIRDRIVLSESLTGGAITTLLAPFNVTAARFFINGVQTRTDGIDAVVRYVLEGTPAGRFDFSAAANFNDTTIERVPTSTSTIPDAVLFGRQNQLRFEDGAPDSKLVFATDWSRAFAFGRAGANLRVTRYGHTFAPGTTVAGDLALDPKTVVDIELNASPVEHLTVAAGADNLFDAYPNAYPAALNTTGATAFSSFSPFGFNGRFLYARATYAW